MDGENAVKMIVVRGAFDAFSEKNGAFRKRISR